MTDVWISDRGDDSNDGSSATSAVKSWKRVKQVAKGSTTFHVIGESTMERIKKEAEG